MTFNEFTFNYILAIRKQWKLEVLKISFSELISRVFNMATMFLPIKVLFVLSGMKTFSIAEDIEIFLGRDIYVIFLVGFVAIFYVTNVLLHIYKGRVINTNLSRVKGGIEFERLKITNKQVKNSYVYSTGLVSDLLILLSGLIIIFLLSTYMGVFYLVFLILFLFVLPYYIKFDINHVESKIGLNAKQKFKMFNGLFFLPIFIFLVVLTLNDKLDIMSSILCLMVARMSASSFGSIYSNQILLRGLYSRVIEINK